MNLIKMTLLLALPMFVGTAMAQKAKEEIVIQTSAECNQCKERIEEKLNYTSGIYFADLDVPTKKLTVKYNTKKISRKEILTIINNLGYDADETKAEENAYKALPECCKVNGMEK